MKDYTQNKEQDVMLNYFGSERGTALDIGANDGILFSNSRALIELGFNGVLVEPAEEAFRKLRNLYDAHADISLPKGLNPVNRDVAINRDGQLLTLINAAIATQDGPLTFYSSGTHLKKGDTDLLSTTRHEELARWKKSGEQFAKTTVRGITFATMMREFGQSHFDFISIDAEGADYSILEQIDLTAVGCKMLCVEVNARGDAEFVAYAKKHGMRLHWSCYENRIFVR